MNVRLTCPECARPAEGDDIEPYAAEQRAFHRLAFHIQAAHGNTPESAAVKANEVLRQFQAAADERSPGSAS